MLQILVTAVFLIVTKGAAVNAGVTRGDTPVNMKQYFLSEPDDMVAITGDHVLLRCQVANLQAPCQWTKDGFGLGQDVNLAAYPRYSLEHKDDFCHLNIYPVLIEDEGEYQCQVVAGDNSLTSRSARLTVNSQPGVPFIKQAKESDVMDVVEGEEVELECETLGAKPNANIQWRDKNGDLIMSKMTETVSKNSLTNTWKTVSSIKLAPTDDMKITCSAFNEVFPEPRISQPMDLRLNYKPKLSLNVTEDTKLNCGHDVTILCAAKAYPEVLSYKWFINEEEIPRKEGTNTLTLGNISKELHKAEVKCQAKNRLGTSEVSTILNIEFMPRFTTHPESQIAKHGETVTFKCEAEGNPVPDIVWFQGNENENLIGVGDSLTITASDDSEDVYKCKMVVDGEEIVSKPARLDIIRAPVLTVSDTKMVTEGDDVVLKCHVTSLDNDTRVTWIRNNVPVEISNSIRTLKMGNHVDLVIYNIQETQFGDYECFAQNTVGHQGKVVTIEQTIQTSFVSRFLTIVAVVFVIGVVVFVGLSFRQKVMAGLELRFRDRQQQLPQEEQNDVEAPIFRPDRDPTIFDVLLKGMDEKEYLKISEEHFDKIRDR